MFKSHACLNCSDLCFISGERICVSYGTQFLRFSPLNPRKDIPILLVFSGVHMVNILTIGRTRILSVFTGVHICIGTGNGMVKSLLHSNGDPCTACNATLAIIRG